MSRETARRFHFLKEIASGGFGSVYVCKVMEADGFARLMAVKLLHQRWSDNLEISRRMKDEARLLGALRHRNIVNVFGFTTIGGRVAVMMEYLEAVDLKVVIGHVVDRGAILPLRAALEITSSVASALDAAWNQPPFPGERPLRVIHRDIKPSNIMLDESGTVKVLDFGVARAEFEHRESHTQELQFGSVEYMPPERLFFEPETDRSDVYGLGVTLFELMTGDRFGKARGRAEKHAQAVEERLATLRGMNEAESAALVPLLRSMLAYSSDERPSSAEVVQRCRALARICASEGLGEWAEREIPVLVTLTRGQMRDPNPLTDSILVEDLVPQADTGEVVRADDGIFGSDAGFGTEEVVVLDDEAGLEAFPVGAPAAVGSEVFVPDDFADDAPTRIDVLPPEPPTETLDPLDIFPVLNDTAVERPEVAPAPLARPASAAPPILDLRKSGPVLSPPVAPTGVVAPEPQGVASPGAAFPEDRDALGSPRSAVGAPRWVLPVFGGSVVIVVVAALAVGWKVSGGGPSGTSAPEGEPAGTTSMGAPAQGGAGSPSVGGLRFVAAGGQVKRVTVSCDGRAGEGIAEASVAGPKAASCVVTVIMKDRTRRRAQVADATEGTYTCFTTKEDACTR